MSRRAMEARGALADTEEDFDIVWSGSPIDRLIDQLVKDYPPRCKLPSESLEEHARYAGKVELVQSLVLKYSRKD